MTPNDFLKIILEQGTVKFEFAPQGWYLTKDLAEQWKCSKTAAIKYVNKGIKLGIVDKKKFHVKVKGVGIRKWPHYFFKDEKKPKNKN